MGEVYMKITSDNPKEYHNNQRFLKKSFIVVYFLSAGAFALSLAMIFTFPKISTDIGDDAVAIIALFIIIIGLLAVLIGYHFFKYYKFFVKMKWSQIKTKKKCTW